MDGEHVSRRGAFEIVCGHHRMRELAALVGSDVRARSRTQGT
jgi:hypothetical protein